jgi:hypothetical protein
MNLHRANPIPSTPSRLTRLRKLSLTTPRFEDDPA